MAKSSTVHGVKLNVFEVLGRDPKSIDELNTKLALNGSMLYRLLRALASMGTLSEHPNRRFSTTEAGETLRSEHPQSLRGVVLLREGPEHYLVWQQLGPIVKDGIQNGFVRAFGLPAFEYALAKPDYAQSFDDGMTSYSTLQTAWVLEALESIDFGKGHMCDIGGGQGHLLCSLLSKYPHLTGIVLERAGLHASEQNLWATNLNVQDRHSFVQGDMFVSVPVADIYLLKMVLHNWNDAECVLILETIRNNARPGARVFIAENVIPDIHTPHFAKLFDIHMMCWGAGRERTEAEFSSLFNLAGWNFAKCWRPVSGDIAVIEGRLA